MATTTDVVASRIWQGKAGVVKRSALPSGSPSTVKLTSATRIERQRNRRQCYGFGQGGHIASRRSRSCIVHILFTNSPEAFSSYSLCCVSFPKPVLSSTQKPLLQLCPASSPTTSASTSAGGAAVSTSSKLVVYGIVLGLTVA